MIMRTRREVLLSAALAAAAFGADRRMALIPSAHAEAAAAKGFYTFKVGEIEVTTVFDGILQLPPNPSLIANASVEDTKAALRAGGLDDSKVVIPFTVTIVKIGGKTVMFDSGTGGQLVPSAGSLAVNMQAAGIDPKSISTIVVTHFHSDHIFGLMQKDTNAQVYPDAEIVVPEVEYKFWTDPAVFTRLAEGSHGLAKRIQATLPTWKNVRVLAANEGVEAAPGIRAIPAYGHTPGHTAYAMASGDKQLVVLADLTNIPVLFARHPDWHASFDIDAETAEASRRKLFDQVVAEKAVITGYHYGEPGAGSIAKDGGGYAYIPFA
jgi:glyoxylase-like metal-dependent hydrolase (beta-lactamase superfamily II)